MNRARTLLAAAAAAALTGCATDFLPPSYLDDLRVLAIVADPLELAPRQDVTLRAEVYLSPGATVASARWTFCPLSAGAVAAYACAVPQCEVELSPAPDGSVTANPFALVEACVASSGGALPASLPEVVDTVFRYRVTSSTGKSRDAVLQIPQWTRTAPTDPNLPPVITGVYIGGVEMVPGAVVPPLPVGGAVPVRLVIDPRSVQTYVDAAGYLREETMTGYFFATGGRYSANLTTGVDTTVDLEGNEIPADQASLQVWALALDLRGGQALAGPFTVPITR